MRRAIVTGITTWTVAVVTCLAMWGIAAPPAAGWLDGNEGCNSFGTHDWILQKAIGAAGKRASWVRARVARRASDDPDCKDGIDHASRSWWHAYDRWGDEYGGADEATRVWFRRTQRRLEAGRKRAASKALGIMSHFIADVANPMHTDQSRKEKGVHTRYERNVDNRVPYRFDYDGRDPARPGHRTRRVARVAHRSYWHLVNTYDAHGYNRRVHRITVRQLGRGTNALADLISSL